MKKSIVVLFGDGNDVDVNEKKINFSTAESIKKSLEEIGFESVLCPIDRERSLDSYKFDYCFNLCDGDLYSSSCMWCVCKGLESREKIFTGNNCRCIQNTLNKRTCQEILLREKLPIPCTDKKVHEFPFLMKPNVGHGSMRITPKNIINSSKQYFDFSETHNLEDFYSEEFIHGREIHVALIGEKVIGWSECEFSKGKMILDYTAKWIDSVGVKKNAGTIFRSKVLKSCRDLAVAAFKAVGGTSYGRVDLRVRDDKPFIIDVNPNCCLDQVCSFYNIYKETGKSYTDMVREIVNHDLIWQS
jgi:D-alanine-D-alanine ligase-like ATP-grasp enzyme